MGISAISSIRESNIGKLYSQQNGTNKFALKSTTVDAELKKLDYKLKDGQISESEYTKEKNALESLPQIVYTNDGSSTLKESNVSQICQKESTEEIDKLKKQHASGDISDFAYNANMYLLTNSGEEQPPEIGQKLSLMA